MSKFIADSGYICWGYGSLLLGLRANIHHRRGPRLLRTVCRCRLRHAVLPWLRKLTFCARRCRERTGLVIHLQLLSFCLVASSMRMYHLLTNLITLVNTHRSMSMLTMTTAHEIPDDTGR